jgi:hypothetical protein
LQEKNPYDIPSELDSLHHILEIVITILLPSHSVVSEVSAATVPKAKNTAKMRRRNISRARIYQEDSERMPHLHLISLSHKV